MWARRICRAVSSLPCMWRIHSRLERPCRTISNIARFPRAVYCVYARRKRASRARATGGDRGWEVLSYLRGDIFHHMKLGAISVAAVTPRPNLGYEADMAATLELVDYLCAAGVHGIALLGSTGEFLHLNPEHRAHLVRLAVKRSRFPSSRASRTPPSTARCCSPRNAAPGGGGRPSWRCPPIFSLMSKPKFASSTCVLPTASPAPFRFFSTTFRFSPPLFPSKPLAIAG